MRFRKVRQGGIWHRWAAAGCRPHLVTALFVLLALCAAPFAGFSFINSTNGNASGDSDNYFQFLQPTGLLFADGKLYVADAGKGALYIYTMNGTAMQRQKVVISQASSNPLSNPLRMAYENGTVYIADGGSGKVKTYAGEGSTILEWNLGAGVERASGVAIGSDYLYVTDLGKKRLWVYSRLTRSYFRVGVESGNSDGLLLAPQDVEFYGGRFFVSDSEKGLVYVYDSNLTYLYSIGRGRGGVTLLSPRGLEVYRDRIYVADANANRVVVFTLDGYPVDVLDKSVPWGNLSYPEDVAVEGDTLYVADTLNRLVKAFRVNQSEGNDTVLSQLRAANSSLAYLSSLQALAVKLGLSPGENSYAQELQQAQQDYGNYLFSSASSSAASVSEKAAADQAVLQQGLEVKIKQMVKESQDRIEPYRDRVSGKLADSFAAVDGKIGEANSRLAARDYQGAADLALQLPALADAFVSEAQGKSAQEEELRQNRTVAQYKLQIDSLEARMQGLTAKAEQYRQEVNLSSSEGLLAAARDAVGAGDFLLADSSIALAQTEIGAYEVSVSQLAAEADAALANITASELSLNSSAGRPMLIQADLGPQRAAIEQARQMAYSNPSLAIQAALQAADSAASKVKDAQVLSTAAAAVLVMTGLMAAIAIAFFIHLRDRKKKLLEAGAEKRKGRRSDAGA